MKNESWASSRSFQRGIGLLEDRPGQQHAHRLAADQPRADHPLPDVQHVGRA